MPQLAFLSFVMVIATNCLVIPCRERDRQKEREEAVPSIKMGGEIKKQNKMEAYQQI